MIIIHNLTKQCHDIIFCDQQVFVIKPIKLLRVMMFSIDFMNKVSIVVGIIEF